MTDPIHAAPHPRRSMEEINQFLADEAKGQTLKSTMVREENPRRRLVTVGGGRRKATGSGDRFTASVVEPEFPEGGDPRFRAVLSEMLKLHISKSNDYGTNRDLYANYRAAEQIGVAAWKSCFIRGLEKVQRIANAASGKRLNHESAENSFLDLANHVVIAKVLYDEEQASKDNHVCDCG